MTISETQLSKFLLITFFVIASSCQKQEIIQQIQVIVATPAENSTFTLPGLLPVKLTISAPQKISYVRLSVIAGDQSPVFQPKYIYPDTSLIDVNFNFELNEPAIEKTGLYFLQITTDAGEVSNTFIKINLESKPLVYKGFYLSTKYLIYETKVIYIDDHFLPHPFIIINGNYSLSAVLREEDKFIILSKNPDKINSFDFEDGLLSWNHEPDLDFPEIYSLCVNNKLTFVGKGNGRIVALSDNSGAQILTTLVLKDSVPAKFGFTEQYFVSDLKTKNQLTRALAVFYQSTGSKKHVISHEMEVVDFYQKEKTEVFITFGNNYGIGIITTYNIEGNYFGSSVGICDSPISSSCRISEDDFLFSNDKSISSVNSDNFIVRNIVSLPDSIIKMTYNDIDNQLFVATTSTIYLFSYPAFEEIYSYKPGETIKGIDLRFGY